MTFAARPDALADAYEQVAQAQAALDGCRRLRARGECGAADVSTAAFALHVALEHLAEVELEEHGPDVDLDADDPGDAA